MAPEQTGRMNRSIDSRSDLYSLGVTLYEMLTGTRPFAAADPMEWVHCHIARRPVPPAERLKHVPAVVSAIIMKLLAKTAEERYRTAAGLDHDLRRCLAEWEARRRIDEFALGQHDMPDRLFIPEKLYGREREIGVLLAAFDRVVTSGASELVLVSGYSGIGKSSVVNEVHKALVPPRGLFAAGKYDQYKRDIPYSTLVQAFHGLVRSLLGKSEADLEPWRDALREALGPNGRLVVDLIPELKLIVGEQPPIPELPVQDAQRRFQLVFRRFISVFARPEHPLVLFLDDLQWLDAATLDLLEDLLTQRDVRNLMLIGAYRDDEVDPAHPLRHKLDSLRRVGAAAEEIALAPLALNDVWSLIADTLRCEPEAAAALALLVHEKTAGNPFFVIQFVRSLAAEGLVAFDYDAACWSWDLDRIHAKGYTDNVVGLMVGELARLPIETQKALRQLACLGNAAEVTTLSVVLGVAEEQVHAALWEAVRRGLVERLEGSYRFVHDRVQEGAYSLIPAGLRAEAHLRIGRLLVAQTAPEKGEEAIFGIANQLNRGAALITQQAEREQLAELNLLAGKRAKASTAYASALTYLVAGAALLAEDRREARHELVFELELQRAECELLSGMLENSELLIAKLLVQAKSKLEKAAAYQLRILLHVTNSSYQAAIDCGLECLRLFGIAISPQPAREEIETEYKTFCTSLSGRSIESLGDLPLATDTEHRTITAVLTFLFAPTVFSDSNLFYMLICRGANLTLKHGVSEATTHIYSGLAQILGPIFHRYEDGLRFATLSYELAEKYRFGAVKAHFAMQNATVWCRPIQIAIDSARRGYRVAIDAGDLSYACYFSFRHVAYLLLQGRRLDMAWSESQEGLDLARRIKFRDAIDLITCHQAFIANMRGETKAFSSFDSAFFDEVAFESGLTGGRMPVMVFCYWTLKLQACLISRDFPTARAAARNAGALVSASQPFIQWANYVYLDALSIAALRDHVCPNAQADELGELHEHLAQLREWADACPMTFLDKYLMVAAEIARLEGRDLDAMHLFEKAIGAAHENGFVHNEAIAYEHASAFYRARGFDQFADVYLRKARHCYVSWGADGKVRQLDELYPNLAEKAPTAQATSTIQAPVEHLDLATVIKVSQAMSAEIVLEKLIETLMRTALEHAGAERGLLLLPRGAELEVEAEARSSGDAVIVRVGEASLAAAPRPELVVNYVLRTHEQVIFDDASAEERFSDDEYLRECRARSILCLPLLKQAKLIGLLYLENNLVRHAFTPARSAVLRVLASEAAISLENSRLYRALEEREAKLRAVQAELAHVGRVTTLGQLTASIAHEVKQPIGAARNNARAALNFLDQPSPDLGEVREALDCVVSDADRAGNIINRIRDHLKKMPPRADRFDLNEAINEVIGLARNEMIKNGVSIQTRLSEGLPPVQGDRVQLQQVILNLILNAIEAISSVVAETRGVSISAEKIETGGILVAVGDSGPGIEPGDLERVFEAFYTTKSGGVGMGLSICRSIISAHGGRLWAETNEPRGAVFQFTLPGGDASS
jgi:predicted ATPase/signal transduction histidine kinase